MNAYNKRGVWLVVFWWMYACPAAAAKCDHDILSNAEKLLVFHKGRDRTMVIERRIKQLPSVKRLSGKKTWKVFEVWGRIDRTRYRMRFIYAILKSEPILNDNGCVLLGEEILDY